MITLRSQSETALCRAARAALAFTALVIAAAMFAFSRWWFIHIPTEVAIPMSCLNTLFLVNLAVERPQVGWRPVGD